MRIGRSQEAAVAVKDELLIPHWAQSLQHMFGPEARHARPGNGFVVLIDKSQDAVGIGGLVQVHRQQFKSMGKGQSRIEVRLGREPRPT